MHLSCLVQPSRHKRARNQDSSKPRRQRAPCEHTVYQRLTMTPKRRRNPSKTHRSHVPAKSLGPKKKTTGVAVRPAPGPASEPPPMMPEEHPSRCLEQQKRMEVPGPPSPSVHNSDPEVHRPASKKTKLADDARTRRVRSVLRTFGMCRKPFKWTLFRALTILSPAWTAPSQPSYHRQLPLSTSPPPRQRPGSSLQTRQKQEFVWDVQEDRTQNPTRPYVRTYYTAIQHLQSQHPTPPCRKKAKDKA